MEYGVYEQSLNECDCACHAQHNHPQHEKPCCGNCPHCMRDKIPAVFLTEHVHQCMPVTIVDGDPMRNPTGAV